MNIHCILTFTILLIAVQAHPAKAQRGWDNTYHYHYHHHYDKYDSPYVEIRQPKTKVIDIVVVDEDYTKSLEKLHLFEPVYHLRPIYHLPTIHLPHDVYIDHRYPYPYAIEEPIIDPFRRSLYTTMTVSYKTKILPVIRLDDENKETDDDTNLADTKTKTPNGETNTNKKQGNTNGIKDPVKNPEPVNKSEMAKQPENDKKPEPDQKNDIEKVSADKVTEKKVETGSTDNSSVKDADVNSNPNENNDAVKPSETGTTDTKGDDTVTADVAGEATA